mmetsp:Transcript_10684/g.29688  ORF Transcript_10684/g.29688 Transcript_10684/m.29688 type:complete len:272 (-) Transcript_10684:2835-3650(-)
MLLMRKKERCHATQLKCRSLRQTSQATSDLRELRREHEVPIQTLQDVGEEGHAASNDYAEHAAVVRERLERNFFEVGLPPNPKGSVPEHTHVGEIQDEKDRHGKPSAELAVIHREDVGLQVDQKDAYEERGAGTDPKNRGVIFHVIVARRHVEPQVRHHPHANSVPQGIHHPFGESPPVEESALWSHYIQLWVGVGDRVWHILVEAQHDYQLHGGEDYVVTCGQVLGERKLVAHVVQVRPNHVSHSERHIFVKIVAQEEGDSSVRSSAVTQ